MAIRIDGILMDLALSEEITFPGEVTKYPAETGSDFTDHIRDLPVQITLECIVSDTPVGVVATERGDIAASFEEGEPVPLPSVEALARLRDMKARRLPVVIETSIGVFDNMACTEITVSVDKDKSPGNSKRLGALFFTAKFEFVVVITNKRTVTRVAMPTGAKTKVRSADHVGYVNGKILWRHGAPPGSANITAITRVTVGYSKSDAISPEEAVAAGLVLPDAPFVIYSDVEDGGRLIKGQKRKDLVADITRDLDNGTANFFGAPNAFVPGGKPPPNLPAGVSIDRFELPDLPPVQGSSVAGVGFVGLGR